MLQKLLTALGSMVKHQELTKAKKTNSTCVYTNDYAADF
jgi:hypothetical protein